MINTNFSRHFRNRVLSLLLCLGAAFPSLTAAQVHPDKKWKTLEVDQFSLIYDAENQQLAEVYAERLAHLRTPFTDYWTYFPRKTVVVLNDRTDLTNGYATFLPYSLIMIYPVVPGPQETIGEYNDWAWEILIHEYTHILEFNQRRGVVWGLSYIFGSIMTPNALLPRWWLEGAAVEQETRFSDAGRLRSKMQTGTLRALALNKTLEDMRLVEINEFTIPTFPYGGRPYLMGSLLWSDWIDAKGAAAVKEIHDRTGGRVPYFLAGALEPVMDGKNQVELFSETQSRTLTEARKEIADLSVLPLTEGHRVDPTLRESLSPAVSPDGLKLAYIGKDETLRRRMQILVRPQTTIPFDPSHRIQWFGKEFEPNSPSTSPLPRGAQNHDDEDAPPGGNITRVSWHPNSLSFVFDQVSEKNRFVETSDLWSFDLLSGKAEKITKDARAREPSYSPDGKKIVFVQVEAGQTHLAIFDRETKSTHRVFTSPAQGRISFPNWLSPNTLLFSLRTDGKESALTMNVSAPAAAEDSSERPTTEVLQAWKDPQFISVEKSRILFTSTKNGVRNLFTAKLDFSEIRPVTHSATHVMMSSFDESTQKYYYTEVTDAGFQMKTLAEGDIARLPAELPVITSSWESRYKDFESPFANETKTARTQEATDYSAWPYMYPRYWLPFVGWDDRGTYLTVSTSASDPLGKHAYSITGSYDSGISRASYIFGYVNQSFWPRLTLSSYDYSTAMATPGTYARQQLIQGSVSWEVSGISPNWFVGVGANSGVREKFASKSSRAAPFLVSTYRNAFQTGFQVTPESGWLGSYQFSAPRDFELARTFFVSEASGTLFWSKWLPQRNALMLKVQGRYSDEVLQVETMEQSVSILTTGSTPFPEYLNRGYPSGAFLGKSILSSTIEYRFPIARLDMGSDHVPFYLHRVHGAIVADGTFFDGIAYNFKDPGGLYYRSEWGRGFWSAGAEARFDMNLGYHIPLTTAVGLYFPLETRFIDSSPRLGVSLIL